MQADVAGHFAPSMAAVDLTTERLVSEVLQSADGIAAAAGGMSSAYGQQQPQQQLQQEFRQQPGVFRSAAARSSPTQAGALGGAGSVSRLPGEQQRDQINPSKIQASMLRVQKVNC